MNRHEPTSFETEEKVSSRAGARRRRSRVALGALLAALSIASQAAAGPDKNETIDCPGNLCVDSYEIRCAQASGLMCLTVASEDISNDFATYLVSVVATLPTTMLGEAEIGTFGFNSEKSFCMIRPYKPGTMRALVSVTASGLTPLEYNIRAQCYAGDIIDGLQLKKTTLSLKQDQ
jgi:hypothetical protein